MIVALVCLQALTQQPLTVDVVSYQRVQNALPNGAPDLNAPDNYYIKVKTHFVLAVDSNTFAPDEKGSRQVDAPEQRFSYIETYTSSGDARGSLAEAFKEIRPMIVFGKRKVGEVTFGRDRQTVSKGSRYVAYLCKTTTEEVETHSDRGDRVTRTLQKESWSKMAEMRRSGTVFDPSVHRIVWTESKPDVRIDPPIYTFAKK